MDNDQPQAELAQINQAIRSQLAPVVAAYVPDCLEAVWRLMPESKSITRFAK